MSKKYETKQKIQLLLVFILDDGLNGYENEYKKCLLRFNEFYDTNKVDIINSFSKVILNLPVKTRVYSNLIFSYKKADITVEIFKKLIDELQKIKNPFIYQRVITFCLELVKFNVIPEINLTNFVTELINKKNTTLISILIRSIYSVYNKKSLKNKNFNDILIKIIDIIYKANLLSKNDIVLNSLYNYSTITNSEEDTNTYNLIPDMDIPDENNENNINGSNADFSNNINYDIFTELTKINYNTIFLPDLVIQSLVNDSDIIKNYSNIYCQLEIMDIMDAFKDGPYKGIDTYLFNKNIEEYNKEKIIENFNISSIDMILNRNLSDNDICYLINFILCVLKHKKSYFLKILEDKSTENTYVTFIKNLLLNDEFMNNLTIIQINNLIQFLCKIISDIFNVKMELLNLINDLNNDTNKNSKMNMQYFLKSFYEQISNLISQDNVEKNIYFPEKKIDPIKPDSLLNCNYYKELYSTIGDKTPLPNDYKEYFKISDENEFLYNFISCLLFSRNNSLIFVSNLIDFYSDTLKQLINDNSNKEKIVLKAIFDVYGNSIIHFLYIIDLFGYKNLLSHITVINYIFTEKLFQNKENGLIYCYYTVINNSIENCYYMLEKLDDEFQNLAKNYSKEDDDKRKETQAKMDLYGNEVSLLKKQKDVICDEVLGSFYKLYEMSEKLGGNDYKEFIKKCILDEIALFQKRNYVVKEENVENMIKMLSGL